MSPRVTRASARQAANQSSPSSSETTTAVPAPASTAAAAAPASTTRTGPSSGTPATATPAQPSSSRKRKNAAGPASSPPAAVEQPSSTSRRSKRQKVTQTSPVPAPAPPPTQQPPSSSATRRKKGKAPVTMSSPDSPAGPARPSDNAASASSSRRSSRNKKNTEGGSDPTSRAGSSRRAKKSQRNRTEAEDEDVHMAGTDDRLVKHAQPPPPPPPPEDHHHHAQDSDDDDDDHHHRYDDDDDDDEDDADDDPFGGFGGHGGPPGLSSTLRALTGMMAGSSSSRFRYLLDGLRRKDDPDKQLVAVQELSEILLISNEDNLAGQFSPDAFVKELVSLMQPNELTGEQHPEIMLLACRSLANMMEALPASTASVVYGGAVSVLCQKLLEIDYIDLAEQALSTLEKISIEYPASIVREGGLTACLSYLDFFATGTQRVAVTTAANCCRNIPEDSFPVIKDVMPILLNVLGSSDQRVVEQGSLCVSRIVESFRNQPSKLEELVSVNLLKAILRLLLPGATNLIGPNIHTQFIRVLAFTARASPRLSAELFKMNVVETLYQILTGVSPPSGTEDVASKLDSVLIMQALIHRPREQVLETLNVVCELLPSESEIPAFNDRPGVLSPPEPSIPSSTPSRRNSSNEKRIELLEGCKAEVKRFALILFPTLTDAFSSTVNLSVRQKVLTAQLKMLSNLDVDILEEALKAVPFASFLASILSQQDHPTLVMSALLATELLLRRLDNIYRYQLYREGVIAEITKLATEAVEEPTPATSEQPTVPETLPPPTFDQDTSDDDDEGDDEEHQPHHSSDDEHDKENEGNDDDEDENEIHQDDATNSEGSTMSLDAPRGAQNSAEVPMKSRIARVARRFLEEHETEKQGKAMKKKALKILNTLSSLAGEIETLYTQRSASPVGQPSEHGVELFRKLSSYFDTDVLESVTSAELLASGVVKVLERIFSNPNEELAAAAQADFLQVFMGHSVKSKPKTGSADSPATPFSIMIHKLQDLLSRSEHFEVLTVHQNAMDGNRSSATSMLAKQIRLKLSADESSGIPAQYRNVMVSIHAITTFKSLEDYLRPRISMNDRPSRSDAISRALASMVGASGARGMPPGFPFGGAGRLGAGDGLSAFMPSDALQRALGSFGGGPPGMSAGLGLGDSQTTPGRTRHYRKRRDAKSDPKQDAPATPEPSSSNGRSLRRSSRRQPTTDDAAASAPPVPPESENDLENALECADEKQMSDDEDDDDEMAEMAAEEEELRLLRDLDAGMDMDMDDMDEEMDEHETPERSAVNLEVAAGGNITARKEDGTRVPTPSQTRPLGSLPSRTSALAAALAHSPSPSSSSRPALSYAGALQATPKDWHLEFSIDGKVIPNDTTIYRAVHRSAMSGDDHTRANVWTNLHSVKFKRVPGPAPEPSGVSFGSADSGAEAEEGGTPGSLTKHPATTSILRLLKMLHDLNANIDDVIVENKDTLKLNVEPLSQFVNTKLTAKLNRQLEEPLIVASNCLPSWSEDLARLYPFLFPFETRHLFLQSTSFGYARSMTRWQAAQSQEETRRDRRDERPFLGRLQRQKVRISRSKILESAIKVMELYGAAQHILEVEYFDEVGTGLGPTLEFFSSVSKEFSKKKLKLWRENDAGDDGEYVNGANGLFPRPLSSDYVTSEDGEKILQLFKVLGKFVARSMIDSRIIDINFNPIFFRIGEETSGVRPSLGAVKAVDPMLAKSLTLIKKFALAKKEIEEHPNRTAAQKVADMENIIIGNSKIDDLCLDFTLPGSPEIELIPNGAQVALTIDNVDLYLERVVDMTLGIGVRRQVDAFRAGFSEVFPYSALSAFTPDELCILFGRTDEDWSLETLMDSIKADHGYNMDSKSVRNLLQTMSELTPAQRRDFLQFTTGSPKLPIGGFKSLTPMFTVVCKPSEPPYTSDDYLPSVMTCVNYLKLPDYSNIEVMRKQLFTAIKEGQGAFHLS